jgi:hypothetical protein
LGFKKIKDEGVGQWELLKTIQYREPGEVLGEGGLLKWWAV